MQHHKEAAPPPSLKPSEDNSDSQWWRHPPHPIIPWSQGLRDYHCNICKFTMCLNNISFHTSRFCLLAVLVLLVLSLTKISGCFYFEYFNSNLKPDACLKTNVNSKCNLTEKFKILPNCVFFWLTESTNF